MELDPRMNPTFSVIVPIYNDEKRIATLVDSYTQALCESFESWELLLIVNGSRDRSFEVATEISTRDSRIVTLQLARGGWGRAVKLGLTQARGQFICYTNGARTKPADLVLALRYAAINEQVLVKASRIIRESWFRKVGSTLYNLECRLLFKVPIWDVNGTPKVLPRKILSQLPPVERLSDGDLIDAQLMAWCFKANIHILEMPVLATQRLGGRSTTTLKSAVKMYLGLLKLRLLGLGND